MAKFRRKPLIIEAIRIKQEMTIDTPNGIVKAKAGDWLLNDVEGKQYPCIDSVFRESYEPADEDAEAMFLEESDKE